MSKMRGSVHASSKVIESKGKLTIPEELKDPGFAYRFVNDSEYRLSDVLDMGYNFVPASDIQRLKGQIGNRGLHDATAKDGNYICKVVDHTGMKAYLMRIEKSLLEERNREKALRVDEISQKLSRTVAGVKVSTSTDE